MWVDGWMGGGCVEHGGYQSMDYMPGMTGQEYAVIHVSSCLWLSSSVSMDVSMASVLVCLKQLEGR
jgi:hypothetical protein